MHFAKPTDRTSKKTDAGHRNGKIVGRVGSRVSLVSVENNNTRGH
jgi:hypothetical protein